jgi:hypothetical protein
MPLRSNPWPAGMPCWADPAGAVFWLAQTDGSALPDRGD